MVSHIFVEATNKVPEKEMITVAYVRPARPNPQLEPFADQIRQMLVEKQFIRQRSVAHFSWTHSDFLSLHLSLSEWVKYSKNTPTRTTYKDSHYRRRIVEFIDMLVSRHALSNYTDQSRNKHDLPGTAHLCPIFQSHA